MLHKYFCIDAFRHTGKAAIMPSSGPFVEAEAAEVHCSAVLRHQVLPFQMADAESSPDILAAASSEKGNK